jgi:hypothetical protein
MEPTKFCLIKKKGIFMTNMARMDLKREVVEVEEWTTSFHRCLEVVCVDQEEALKSQRKANL